MFSHVFYSRRRLKRAQQRKLATVKGESGSLENMGTKGTKLRRVERIERAAMVASDNSTL